jgi:putative RNA 2'-phosphotransferase
MYKTVSKWMSYVLRHHPEEAHLLMDNEGFVLVDYLLVAMLEAFPNSVETKERAREIVYHVVVTNDKGRFEYSLDRMMIRACQGHSVKLNMTLTPFVPSNTLYHGTAEKNLNTIALAGILKGHATMSI